MSRPRAPAFGKSLLERRRAGEHPLIVHLEYSESWFRRDRCDFFCDGSHPFVSVRPSEFQPGRFDWHMLTGCDVELFDPGGELDGGDADPRPGAPLERFRQLVIEVGRVSAQIWIYGPHRTFPLPAHWMRWWPAEVEAINGKRREAWGRRCRAWLDGRDRRAAPDIRAA